MKATLVSMTLTRIVKPSEHGESLMEVFWTGVQIPSGPLKRLAYLIVFSQYPANLVLQAIVVVKIKKLEDKQ